MNPRGGANVSAAEITITETEYERVVRWRAEELERAGYDEATAAELAARPDVDLHRATALIEQGCSPELARRILI
jgi:hypothetical protein